MNIIPKLGNFPDMEFYMQVHYVLTHKHKIKINKVIWFAILQLFIESYDLELLIDILRQSSSPINLSVQMTGDIHSTIHYVTKNDKFIDGQGAYQNYHIKNSILSLGGGEHVMTNNIQIKLVPPENFTYREKYLVADVGSYESETGRLAHGFGRVFCYEDKYIYIGDYHFGDKHGPGTLYIGNMKYVGNFENGSLVGVTTIVNEETGEKYIGPVDGFDESGFGIIYYDGGKVKHIGHFEHGFENGHGIQFSKDGAGIYNGEFNFGMKHGFGYGISQGDHGSYIGPYKNGLRHGHAIQLLATASIVGYYVDGKIVSGTVYWKPTADNQFFGPAIKSHIRWNKFGQTIYVKTHWPNGLITERNINNDLLNGQAKIFFPHDIIYHTNYNNGDFDSYISFSPHFKVTVNKGSIIV